MKNKCNTSEDEDAIIPSWWSDLLACPKCGVELNIASQAEELQGYCLSCGCNWERKKHIISWIDANKNIDVFRWRDFWGKLLNQLNPLSCRLSPLRLLTDWNVNQYYKRTLFDSNLADCWNRHYFESLNLNPGDFILDHGCGRGRNVALTAQLGYRVIGQDISPHPWWKMLKQNLFQVVPPPYNKFPWRNSSFSLVLNVQVIHYLSENKLISHAQEVFRILKPGGYWILLEANQMGCGISLTQRLIGKLYSLETIKKIALESGFIEIDTSYEGFYSPIFPRFINFIRKQCLSRCFDIADYGTWIESITLPERRACWLLRLRKPGGETYE